MFLVLLCKLRIFVYIFFFFFFFNDTATTEIYTLSLHDALPISRLERPAGGGGRGMRVPARQIHGEARAQPMRQPDRNGPLDDVVERVARPEVVTVEHDPGARRAADSVHWALRGERRRRAQPYQNPPHGGRLKMMTIPFVTDAMEGRPSDSGVSRRSMLELPVGNFTSAIASPMAGTTSRAPAESSPPTPPKPVGSAAPVTRSTASGRVTIPPPVACSAAGAAVAVSWPSRAAWKPGSACAALRKCRAAAP